MRSTSRRRATDSRKNSRPCPAFVRCKRPRLDGCGCSPNPTYAPSALRRWSTAAVGCCASRSRSRAWMRSTTATSRASRHREGCAMRREGSPWRGLSVVFVKELSDHLTSARMFVLGALVIVTAVVAVYGAVEQIKDVSAEDPFLFLRLFTVEARPVPSFVSFLAFLVPLMAIGLGFDAINSEHNRHTLS